MFSWVEKISKNIKDLSGSVDKYKSDSIIQSLPCVAYVNKAKKLINEKRIDEAEAVLLKALDISVQDARIYKFLGKIYEQISFPPKQWPHHQYCCALGAQ